MKNIGLATLVLIIVGGLNWGLVGLFNIDLVALLFGADTALANIVYTLVGLSAVYQLLTLKSSAANQRSQK